MSVSLREREEETAERHNRALSLITHDLKSPMWAIIGFSRILVQKAEDGELDEDSAELVRRILKAGEGAFRLIQDIVAMAKLEAGRERIVPVPTEDLEHELCETISVFSFEAASREICLSLNVVNKLPIVVWDIHRLKVHVLNNLLSNALKFTPPGGKVTLEAESEAGHVQLRVIDTGPGVPENERERIFHRFEQADVRSDRVFSGSGLGLHNARLFTRRHGGEIFVEDTPSGEGVGFVVRLPLKAAAGDAVDNAAA